MVTRSRQQSSSSISTHQCRYSMYTVSCQNMIAARTCVVCEAKGDPRVSRTEQVTKYDGSTYEFDRTNGRCNWSRTHTIIGRNRGSTLYSLSGYHSRALGPHAERFDRQACLNGREELTNRWPCSLPHRHQNGGSLRRSCIRATWPDLGAATGSWGMRHQ